MGSGREGELDLGGLRWARHARIDHPRSWEYHRFASTKFEGEIVLNRIQASDQTTATTASKTDSIGLRRANGARRLQGLVLAWAVVSAALFLAPLPHAAASVESSLDQFVIYRNGTLWANDTFSDGATPPSGEGFLGSSSTALRYFTQGGFVETGGKLLMDSERRGLPVFINVVNANTGTTILSSSELTRVHTGRAITNTLQSSTDTSGLKRDHHTFDVLALYDLTPVPVRSDNYGIGLVDSFSGSGRTRDRMRLSVVRSSVSNTARISFWRNDQTTEPQENFTFGSHALQGGHDQIVLRLRRTSTANDTISASYAYVDGANVGMDISNPANLSLLSFSTIANTSSQPATIFNDFIHTRAEFRQLASDADNQFHFARLTTGSPVSIGQEVFTGTSPSSLTFNYRFETAAGELTVKLGSEVLGTITAPATITDDFASASFLVGAGLLNQTLTLNFVLDGPTGSKILLDSIDYAGLVNSDFSTGDLSAWTVVASGSGGAGVLTIVAVPEPETYALMMLGLGLVGYAAKRRRSRA